MPYRIKVHPDCKKVINKFRETGNSTLINAIQREFESIKKNPFQMENIKTGPFKGISAAKVQGRSYRLFYQFSSCCNSPQTCDTLTNFTGKCEGLIYFFLFASRQECDNLYRNPDSLIPKSLL